MSSKKSRTSHGASGTHIHTGEHFGIFMPLGGVISSDYVASASQGQITSLVDPQTSEGEDGGHAGDVICPGLASASSRRLNILVKAIKSALCPSSTWDKYWLI